MALRPYLSYWAPRLRAAPSASIRSEMRMAVSPGKIPLLVFTCPSLHQYHLRLYRLTHISRDAPDWDRASDRSASETPHGVTMLRLPTAGLPDVSLPRITNWPARSMGGVSQVPRRLTLEWKAHSALLHPRRNDVSSKKRTNHRYTERKTRLPRSGIAPRLGLVSETFRPPFEIGQRWSR